jgi:hypothetical protein
MEDLIGIADLIGSAVGHWQWSWLSLSTDRTTIEATSYIITVAHRLPGLPPMHRGRYLERKLINI